MNHLLGLCRQVGTRTSVQVRTHSQKYFLKLRKLVQTACCGVHRSCPSLTRLLGKQQKAASSNAQGVSNPPPTIAIRSPHHVCACTDLVPMNRRRQPITRKVSKGTFIVLAPAANHLCGTLLDHIAGLNTLREEASELVRKDNTHLAAVVDGSALVCVACQSRHIFVLTRLLRSLLCQHWEHPYPNKAEKRLLAVQAQIGFAQVTNWFVNARARIWKPIVLQTGSRELPAKGARPKFMTAKSAPHDSDIALASLPSTPDDWDDVEVNLPSVDGPTDRCVCVTPHRVLGGVTTHPHVHNKRSEAMALSVLGSMASSPTRSPSNINSAARLPLKARVCT